MAQFAIHENKDPRTNARIPFLVDIQADILSSLATRIVVPLRRHRGDAHPVISRLHPILRMAKKDYVAVVSELAAIPLSSLGKEVGSASAFRQAIIDASDLLLTGF